MKLTVNTSDLPEATRERWRKSTKYRLASALDKILCSTVDCTCGDSGSKKEPGKSRCVRTPRTFYDWSHPEGERNRDAMAVLRELRDLLYSEALVTVQR